MGKSEFVKKGRWFLFWIIAGILIWTGIYYLIFG